jgi:hypothetical protein
MSRVLQKERGSSPILAVWSCTFSSSRFENTMTSNRSTGDASCLTELSFLKHETEGSLVERFIIGHNVDPSNWRARIERLTPRCLEIFVPPRYCAEKGLTELRDAFEQMAEHPAVQALEFASCHFPWGEPCNGHSKYALVDDQYFFPFLEIAQAFHGLCSSIGLTSDRTALNFHNLYELPRSLLERLRAKGRIQAFREAMLAHAAIQTETARKLLDILEVPITLVSENNPPVGDGERMSIVDVFSEDIAGRAREPHVRACMDLSHFFMTRFYYDLALENRSSFPYLELESDETGECRKILDFDGYLDSMRPMYFHVSDTKAPGADREFEGIAIGTGDTPWTDVLPSMARYASHAGTKLFLIIEIKGGHTAEGIRVCSDSERRLREIIEDCFASGFLDAISGKESAP